MRGDSDDIKVTRYVMIGTLIWLVFLIAGLSTAAWVLVAFCAGFASSLALLAIMLYKDWWPAR
jgi:hypothetical protein